MNKYSRRATAAEIVNAGKCNLDCAYCYIPKTKEMNYMHDDIVRYLDSGKFIDDLEEMYGGDLTAIGAWGTEPTLTLDIVAKWMPTLLDTFPKFNNSNISSNFLRNPKYLLTYVDALPKDREFYWSVQYSLDGPEFITDVTRHPKATQRIIKNLKEFLTEASKRDLGDSKVALHCKATWNESIVEMVGQDLSKVKKFYEFFDNLYGELDDICVNPQVVHNKVNAPFLALPGKYTVQHGKYWSDIHDKCYEYQDAGMFPNLNRNFTAYLPRLQRLFDFGREYYTKPEMFSCSAGDSQYGLDHKSQVHACHRTFYLNDDNYIQSITKDCGDGNWDVEHYNNDRINDIRTNMIVSKDDDYGLKRFVYANTTHHYFIQNRMCILQGLVLVLAKAGQISKAYNDENLARLFAEFLTAAFSCPIEYNLSCGNMNLLVAGIIKLLGNGTFETLVKRVANPYITDKYYK